MAERPRILLAGMGNVLAGDDGFGVAVAGALAARPLPEEVKVIEVGIGGIHLVQELMTGYDMLIVIDAVDRGAAPGTLFILEPEVAVLDSLSDEERSGVLADTHYAVPSRALTMAQALGVLPERVLIVGCQGREMDGLAIALSPEVEAGVGRAVTRIEGIIADACRPAPAIAAAAR
jgi:hydrogenase maturation protease